MTKRQVKTKSRRVRKPFKRRSPRVQGAITTLDMLRSAKLVREYLAYSLVDMGAKLAEITGRARPYAKSTVHAFEAGTSPINDDLFLAYGKMIARKLTRQARGHVVGVKLAHNSPWRITAWSECQCGLWFKMKRIDRRKCYNKRAHDRRMAKR